MIVLGLGATSCGAWPGEEQTAPPSGPSSPGSPSPSEPTPVTVRYEVDGQSKASVFYFDESGEYHDEDVVLPWHTEVAYGDISEATISIVANQPTILEPHLGTLTCTVAIDNEVVVTDQDVPSSRYDDRHVECGGTQGGEDR